MLTINLLKQTNNIDVLISKFQKRKYYNKIYRIRQTKQQYNFNKQMQV